MQTAKLIGSPGSGKTTKLLEIMEKVIEDQRLEPDQIGFVSFTRAARAEAAERAAKKFGLPVKALEDLGWFRTLHSVCYKCLDVKEEQLLSGDKASREWFSERMGINPPKDADSESGFTSTKAATPEEQALHLWHVARQRLCSFREVHEQADSIGDVVPWDEAIGVIEKYEQRKALDNKLDFTDTLLRFSGRTCHVGTPPTDHSPSGWIPGLRAWIVDEAQDLSRLMELVVRRLAGTPTVRYLYLAGDPFQSIHGWMGADPDCFLDWECSKEQIMPQSWRCPDKILTLAEQTLSPCSNYINRNVNPAEHTGRIEKIDEVELDNLLRRIKPDESWLVIARTNFHAQQLASRLDHAGVPWVPTSGSGGWERPVKAHVMGLFHELQHDPELWFSHYDWRKAIKFIPSVAKPEKLPLIERGMKKSWDTDGFIAPAEEILLDDVATYGGTDELIKRIRDGRWKEWIEGASRFAEVASEYGTQVAMKPKVRVGTIHSVKGSEADNVILSVDASQVVSRARQTQDGEDEERRISYVGISRARKNLYLAHSKERVRIPIGTEGSDFQFGVMR